jgi:hypothetical protein
MLMTPDDGCHYFTTMVQMEFQEQFNARYFLFITTECVVVKKPEKKETTILATPVEVL